MRLARSFLRQVLPVAGISFAASFAVALDAGPHPVAAASEMRTEAPSLAENNVAMTKMMTARTIQSRSVAPRVKARAENDNDHPKARVKADNDHPKARVKADNTNHLMAKADKIAPTSTSM